MKRIYQGMAVFLTLVLFLGNLPIIARAAETIAISASAVSGVPGDVVTIDICLDENPGCIGLQIHTSFDSTALRLVGIQDVKRFQGGIHPAVTDSLDAFRFTWANDTLAQNITVTGKIAVMTFEILPTAVPGKSYPIALSIPVHGIVDTDMQVRKAALNDGGVMVLPQKESTPVCGIAHADTEGFCRIDAYINPETTAAESVILVCAVYDAGGGILSVRTCPVTLSRDEGLYKHRFAFREIVDIADYKLFVFNKMYIPLGKNWHQSVQ